MDSYSHKQSLASRETIFMMMMMAGFHGGIPKRANTVMAQRASIYSHETRFSSQEHMCCKSIDGHLS